LLNVKDTGVCLKKLPIKITWFHPINRTFIAAIVANGDVYNCSHISCKDLQNNWSRSTLGWYISSMSNPAEKIFGTFWK
jgi:hypothetical protein